MNAFQTQRRRLSYGAVNATLAEPASAQGTDRTRLAAQYELADDIVNLENAYYGIMARAVAADYKRNIDFLNRHHSHYLRNQYDGEGMQDIRAELAARAGVAADEIALTRSATESLQCLIANYRFLKAGDTVMISNLDYGTVMDAMRDLAQRCGANVAVVEVPEPATHQNVIDAYAQALRRNPRTRLLLLTHISHRTGLVFPVAEIVRAAKMQEVDVVVDIAQSWGQLDFDIPSLGADFVGTNLHKWVGAPLGLGFLYIRGARLGDIGVHQGNSEFPANDIRARVHAGTLNVPAVMTIPAALAFHARVPRAERAALLRSLRDYWVAPARRMAHVQILTPDDPRMSDAVTSFRLAGRTSFEDNLALARQLAERHRIFTVAREGPTGGACIRVTPYYYTRTDELDRLVGALRTFSV